LHPTLQSTIGQLLAQTPNTPKVKRWKAGMKESN